MAIVLRPIAPADEPFLEEVYAGTRAEELAQVPWTDEEKRAFVHQQFTAQQRHYQQHYPGSRFDVIERDGERVGRLYVARWPQEIRIIDIALVPAARNAGIGASLVRELMNECDASGKRLTIHVERMNRAMSFYLRFGFTEVADRGVYAMMEWRPR